MAKCIFCGSAENLTDEHIFPAALGGNLVVEKGSCKPCNDGFSRHFEQGFCQELALVRFLLRIPNRYGTVPDLPARVEIEGKPHAAEINTKGEVQIPPMKVSRALGDGMQEIIYRAFSQEDGEKLKQNLAKKGIEVERAPLADEIREVEATVHFSPLFLTSPAALRSITKIAYTALVKVTGVNVALQPSFDSIREFIREGKGNSPAHVFFNASFAEHFQIGPHQHSVVLVGDAKAKRCTAVVVLFGSLFYVVHMGNAYDGADFAHTLAVNAQAGEQCEVLVSDLENDFHIIDDVLGNSTMVNDLNRSAEHFIEFLSRCLKIRIQD